MVKYKGFYVYHCCCSHIHSQYNAVRGRRTGWCIWCWCPRDFHVRFLKFTPLACAFVILDISLVSFCVVCVCHEDDAELCGKGHKSERGWHSTRCGVGVGNGRREITPKKSQTAQQDDVQAFCKKTAPYTAVRTKKQLRLSGCSFCCISVCLSFSFLLAVLLRLYVVYSACVRWFGCVSCVTIPSTR